MSNNVYCDPPYAEHQGIAYHNIDVDPERIHQIQKYQMVGINDPTGVPVLAIIGKSIDNCVIWRFPSHALREVMYQKLLSELF